MNNQTKYSDEFKQEAVKLVTEAGYTITKAAERLGVGSTSLGAWVRQTKESDAPSMSANEAAELKRLRKEIKELRMERDILKEAAAYFAIESKKSTRS